MTVPILERSLGRQRLSMFMGAPQTRTIKVARDDLTPLAYTDDGGPAPARRALPGSARGAGGEFRASPPCGSREEGDSFSEI